MNAPPPVLCQVDRCTNTPDTTIQHCDLSMWVCQDCFDAWHRTWDPRIAELASRPRVKPHARLLQMTEDETRAVYRALDRYLDMALDNIGDNETPRDYLELLDVVRITREITPSAD